MTHAVSFGAGLSIRSFSNCSNIRYDLYNPPIYMNWRIIYFDKFINIERIY